MTDDEDLCGEVVYEALCDLPRGHEGTMHHFEDALPPDVNIMLAEAMNKYETAAARYDKARRAQVIGLVCSSIATGAAIYVVVSHWF